LPVAALFAVTGYRHDIVLLPRIQGYFILMTVVMFIYMAIAVRQYSLWLRNNYADLEHKEVWQSFTVLAILLLTFIAYAFTNEGEAYQYAMQVVAIVLICYILWRVETLSDLSVPQQQSQSAEELVTAEKPVTAEAETAEDYELPQTIHDKIGALLQQHCIDTRLYLQHDLTIIQLSKAIGTNRFYLSQYFSSQGLTYNAYINNLRINHFIGLYHKAVATQHNFTAKQLAFNSGYRNYQTFSLVFKQLKGQTVTAWMRDTAK
jgi:AraC-like DNA-binding protein